MTPPNGNHSLLKWTTTVLAGIAVVFSVWIIGTVVKNSADISLLQQRIERIERAVEKR